MNYSADFYTSPLGAINKHILKAPLADDKTSVELVKDNEEDARFFRSLEQKNIKLNKPQLEAVRHFQGPALVLAGAGSGKTRVLISRTGYLITVKKVNPKEIMLVTFTKKASEEMKDRISRLPGLSYQIARSITIGTFHSIFLRLLRSRGYQQQVLSSEKRKQLAIKLILKEKGISDSYEPEALLALLSSYKNKGQTVADMPFKTAVEKEIRTVLQQYERWKKDNNMIDFDDILLEIYQLLLQDQQLLHAMQNRFNYILCDEWQDTNPIQFELIKLIAKPSNNLYVVGDDDQTIYSFNGADSSIILNYQKLFPGSKVITLDINYRSTSTILGLANQVIKYNQQRNEKQLRATKVNDNPPYYYRPNNTDHEANHIIDKITSDVQNGIHSYRDFVILHRTNSSSRAIFDQLVLDGIPFTSYTKGETFYEQPLVKPVIDYLRIALNSKNIDILESILPTLYLNRDSAMTHIKGKQQKQPINLPLKHSLTLPGLKEFQKKQIQDRISLIKQLPTAKPVEAVKKIRKFYDNYLDTNEKQNITLHKEMILETLSEVEASARKFTTVSEFIGFIDHVIAKNKEMQTIRRSPNANAVSLMTIHRAKGLEFPVVFLIGASEGILPHSSSLEANNRKDLISVDKGHKKTAAAIEEERRLAYVAITRAKEELYISSPANYRGEQVEVSRFILDPYTPEKTVSNPTKNSKRLLVWECTSDSCIGWMRITSHEDAQMDSRECPMCKGEMKQAIREG